MPFSHTQPNVKKHIRNSCFNPLLLNLSQVSLSVQNISKRKSSFTAIYYWSHKTHTTLNRLKSRYTLVLPIFLLTVHLVTICPPDTIINYAYQQESCNCKSLPLRHEISVSSTEACSLLLHNCSRAGVTWRLLGVEQSDAVQSVTRLLILRHYCLLSVYCSGLLLVAHTKRSYFCKGAEGQPTNRKKRGLFFWHLTNEYVWSTLKAYTVFCFVLNYTAAFQFHLKL